MAAFVLAGTSMMNETPRFASLGRSGWRGAVAALLIVMAVAIGLALLWFTAGSLFVAFGGVLLAAFIDALARMLKPVLPIGRVWRVTLVTAAMSTLIFIALWRGAAQLPEQVRALIAIIDSQIDVLQTRLLAFGIDFLGPEGGRSFQGLLPDIGQLFGHATLAFGTATSVLTTTILIIVIGVTLAVDPAGYRDSLIVLVPPRQRYRVRQVLDEMGAMLRIWLAGQAVRMLVLGGATWLALYMLGLPGAFVLGIQAGLLNFIPFLGPIVAGVPIALVAMPLGTPMLVWALLIYTLVQSVEGYVVGPLIQKRAADVPAAWTLIGIVLFGTLFGTMGVALAMPLMAIGRIALIRFYVEDWLGDQCQLKGQLPRAESKISTGAEKTTPASDPSRVPAS